MRGMLFVCLLVAGGEASAAREYLAQLESEVIEVPTLTRDQILSKAKLCVVELARNAAASETVLADGATEDTLVSIARVGYSSMLIDYSIRSRMTVLAKDGKFKIRQTNIERMQLDTGSLANTGYEPVGKWWGNGYEVAQKTLEGYAAEVAACIKKEPVAETW